MNEEINEKNGFEKEIELRKSKRKRKNIFKLSLVGFVFLMLVIYLFTPLSQVRTLSLKGNLNFSEEQVLEISTLERKDSLYFIKAKDIENKLNENPLIKSSEVHVRLDGVHVEIEELTPVLKLNDTFYLNDGNTLDNTLLVDPNLGEYLTNITNGIPNIISNQDTITKEKIKSFSTIYFLLTKEERSQIKHVRFFNDNPLKIALFYQDETMLKEIVTEIPLGTKDYKNIAKMFNRESLTGYQNGIFENEVNFNKLTLQNYENEGTSFEYYSIKVIMDIVSNHDVRYHVVPNNNSALEK